MIRSDFMTQEIEITGQAFEVYRDFAFLTACIKQSLLEAGANEKDAEKDIRNAFELGMKDID